MIFQEVKKDNLKGYVPTPHPIISAPSPEDVQRFVGNIGIDETVKLLQLREDKILAERMDPYRHGYEPPHWKDADELLKDPEISEFIILGGNRAGKSEYAAKRVCWLLSEYDECRIWCIHTTHMSSVQMQQPLIYKYLPAEYKTVKKTKITNVSYTQKNGFTEDTFVLPNRAQCYFLNQSQDIKVIEGGECDFIWIDEEINHDWLKTLRYRTVTREGKILLTFTPVSGYTPVIKEYLSGATITEWKDADLLKSEINVPGGKRGTMPYRARCHRPDSAAMWFHSVMNEYSPFGQIAKTLKGRGPYEVKIRAYGWAESLQGTQFPRFGDHNIVKGEDIPEEGTNYMVCDPAGARNWFMLWVRVDRSGRRWVYREWPDVSMGEWAIASAKADGKPGVAQTNQAGRGIEEYKDMILSMEDGEEIAERYIDPRSAGTQSAGRAGGTSLLELLEEDPPMFFTPSAGTRIDERVGIINDWLAYDLDEPICSVVNEPGLYVSNNCENLIYSMREWTGRDGQKGATKDPIDALAYLAVMDPEGEDKSAYMARGVIGSY